MRAFHSLLPGSGTAAVVMLLGSGARASIGAFFQLFATAHQLLKRLGGALQQAVSDHSAVVTFERGESCPSGTSFRPPRTAFS